MGIETKYDYTYYTVIDTEQWRRGNEEWLGYDEDDEGFTWAKAIEFINYKFKNSEDTSVNKYRVDYAGYEQDIDAWIRTRERHKERTVFVQFQDDQLIKTTGGGSLFVLYEEEEEEDEDERFDNSFQQCLYGTTEYNNNHSPDGHYDGNVDGLAGLGGRL